MLEAIIGTANSVSSRSVLTRLAGELTTGKDVELQGGLDQAELGSYALHLA